jgi:beta-glucanase (GH16 family)
MAKIISLPLLTALLLATAGCQRTSLSTRGNWSAGDNWRLVWSDEFDAETLNKENWSYDLGGSGWGNRELQVYTSTPENIRVENGRLVIQAIYNGGDVNGLNYTSARIVTQKKAEFRYGKISARIKLPRGQGPWPAFWMLGADFDSRNWPDCGEIDILESGSSTDTVSGAIHFRGKDNYHAFFSKEITLPGATVYEDYHVYEIEWDKKQVSWLIDGIRYFKRPIKASYMRPFHKPFFILLNLAVGGPESPYTGKKSPDAKIFPQSMYVDWVRVYEGKTRQN